MKDICVIGLGIIGSLWARHYEAAGRLAATWNRSPKPGAPLPRSSAREAAAASKIVHIVVADPPAVEGVLEALAPALTPGHLVIQSSTIDPRSSACYSALVHKSGARYVEAPFTGSKPAAESKKLVYYLGGEGPDLDRAEPILALLSETRLRIGTPEQAASLKLSMNLQLAIMMEALAESLAFARRAGISDDLFFAALEKNAGASGLTRLKEPKLRARDYSPQFSVKHMLKDVRLALGEANGEKLPLTDGARRCLEAALGNGWGDLDFSAVAKGFDPPAN
ncbi:MAG: NAD(P)-dependent oxidoreductase [Spirochaetes bacterium]|nr:NAD(P)-dependent oxidoreductase [Spirochaetota bacterium]